jgi:hypothetical protein
MRLCQILVKFPKLPCGFLTVYETHLDWFKYNSKTAWPQFFFRTLYAECRRVDEEQEIFSNFFVNQRRLLVYSSSFSNNQVFIDFFFFNEQGNQIYFVLPF